MHSKHSTSQLSGISVLLVNGAARCSDLLTGRVGELHTVDGSRETIITFARSGPELVILDMTDEKDSLKDIQTMRTMNPEAEFVGLVDDSPRALQRAASADVDGVVRSPADPDTLHRTLERLAGHINSRRDLKQQKRLTELLVHGLPHPALLFDTNSDTVLLANTRAENLGYAAGSTCGPPLLPESCRDREDVQARFASYAPAQVGEIEIEGNWYDITLAPASPDTLLLFAADVTRKKRLERQRRDVERVVRHDLKTPLNGIIGFSALLNEQDHPPEKIRMFAEQIHDSSTRMLKMINNSLDISRMEEGTYVCRPDYFELTEILCRIENDLERPFRPKRLNVVHLLNNTPMDKKDMDEGRRPIRAWGEPHHIESMLGNLLLNALEAAPDQSTIITSVDTGPDLTISIHNMGSVPKEIRDRFFDRYATSGKRGGTGLGTFSAKLICEAHNGTISFTSSENEGTCVTVRLPGPPSEMQPDAI